MSVNDQLSEHFRAKQDDPAALDVIMTFYLSLPSKSGYIDHQRTWKKLLGAVTTRNLRFKYGLKVQEARDHMASFVEFRNSLPATFLSYDKYYDDCQLLRQTIEEFHNIFGAQLEMRLNSPIKLAEIERQVASFTMSYWPLKASEAAEDEHGFGSAIIDHHSSQENPFEYGLRGEVWTQDFNFIFNADISYELYQVKIASQHPLVGRLGLGPQLQEHEMWMIGDTLVLSQPNCWQDRDGEA